MSTQSELEKSRPPSLWMWLGLVALLALWVDLIRQLGYNWSSDEQYSYGWFVPFLSAGLLWRAWQERPATGPGVMRSWLKVSLAVILLSVPLLRIIHDINQDWPLISWPLTAGIVVVSLMSVYLLGGWTWVRHFAFPICFILVAVKWPYRIEHGLTQGLMKVVAVIAVEVLGWMGIPALQRGNLIEIDVGVLGVDEACSGIRSFQSSIMIALFLGQLYRLSWARRLLLLIFGVGAAFGFNVFRAVFLSVQAANHGMTAVDRWHDPIGLVVVVACFIVVWGLAVLLASRSAHAAVVGQNTSPVVEVPAWPAWFPRLLVVWVVVLLSGTEAWYRGHAMGRKEGTAWWVSFPTNAVSFQPIEIPERARKLLRYDESSSAGWTADGLDWSAFCFRWNAGDPTARMSAQAHRPEYCLTGVGLRMKRALEAKPFHVGDLELPFRRYVFESGSGPLHVFFCLWEDGSEQQLGFGWSKQWDRLSAVWRGRRGLGQQTLEVIVRGAASMEEAESKLAGKLPSLVRIEGARAD